MTTRMKYSKEFKLETGHRRDKIDYLISKMDAGMSLTISSE